MSMKKTRVFFSIFMLLLRLVAATSPIVLRARN
jgi:hypothetical protein